MFETIVYGFSFGAILYLFSIGLSITFGTMHIVNFSHGMIYALGTFFFLTMLSALEVGFTIPLVLSCLVIIPIAWLIERLVIRKLYGVRLDYAMIATYAVLLVGVDIIKMVWGVRPQPLSVPIYGNVPIGDFQLSIYRVLILILAIAIFLILTLFMKKTVVGQIVTAALQDNDGVRCLGINVNKYFSLMFVIGSVLAVFAGILYGPISAPEPYMGSRMLLLAFAVIIVGGMGNLRGTFVASFALGLVMAIVGRFYSGAGDVAAFIVMAGVIVVKSKLSRESAED